MRKRQTLDLVHHIRARAFGCVERRSRSTRRQPPAHGPQPIALTHFYLSLGQPTQDTSSAEESIWPPRRVYDRCAAQEVGRSHSRRIEKKFLAIGIDVAHTTRPLRWLGTLIEQRDFEGSWDTRLTRSSDGSRYAGERLEAPLQNWFGIAWPNGILGGRWIFRDDRV